jgi:hypothetical protein
LDEWDSTDDFPGSGFNRLWSLTRPKRLDLHKFTQACERVRQRPPSPTAAAARRDKQGARFLVRNVRLVRESAATARLPTFSSEGDVFAADDDGDEVVDEDALTKNQEEEYEAAEAEEEEEEFRPKYAAPPSPPKVRKRRSSKPKRPSAKTGPSPATSSPSPSTRPELSSQEQRASTTTATSARQYRRRGKSSPSSSTSSSTSIEDRVRRITPTTVTPLPPPSSSTEDLARRIVPSAIAPLPTSSSSSSTRIEDLVRRITPTTVTPLPTAQLLSRASAADASASAAASTARRPHGGARGDRVVEISFPLARRTPTLRAGQNDIGGTTRLRVMPRQHNDHDDDEAEESLSDADDPFAFPTPEEFLRAAQRVPKRKND